MNYRLLLVLCASFLFSSCASHRQIARSAKKTVLGADVLRSAHVGISIYEPATGRYWYDYQGSRYFVPASNTKLPTCYAAMKYLGDSLPGLKYAYSAGKDPVLAIQPTGDPTFLHPAFGRQPVRDFLMSTALSSSNGVAVLDTAFQDERWGSGWAWDDYESDYMPERSSFPVFGNTITIKLKSETEMAMDQSSFPFRTPSAYFDSLVNRPVRVDERLLVPADQVPADRTHFRLHRYMDRNDFLLMYSGLPFSGQEMPFVTDGSNTALEVLSDSFHLSFGYLHKEAGGLSYYGGTGAPEKNLVFRRWSTIHSQATDSVLGSMMHRSDNFFAEQTLLMVSNEVLGRMNDQLIIDTLLKKDLKDLPQQPRWVDGSGLSRYDLFTPQDFVFILNRMRADFGMERMQRILPTGNEGTLEGRFVTDRNFIFAKTGTLSGVVSLSGFLYTRKNKLLIFSVLVNNHRGPAGQVRKAVEQFIQSVRDHN